MTASARGIERRTIDMALSCGSAATHEGATATHLTYVTSRSAVHPHVPCNAGNDARRRGLCLPAGACYAQPVPTDDLDRDLFRRIRDRVAVVGVGHLPFAKDIGRPISDTAVEAIQLALDDAGLAAEELDGMSMLEMEATHEVSIARRLGVRQITWWDKISYGGGASSATLMPAA